MFCAAYSHFFFSAPDSLRYIVNMYINACLTGNVVQLQTPLSDQEEEMKKTFLNKFSVVIRLEPAPFQKQFSIPNPTAVSVIRVYVNMIFPLVPSPRLLKD